ncbi:MAG: hypothetical protein IJA62_06775 [Ruminococcus sp.]|nr:hypothetical protein [Ruminococcus sp.]
MKKRIVLIAVAVFLIFSLCGCEVISFNVSELMAPPKATGENAAIQKLVGKEAGAGYTLKYPQNGSYRSAITCMDFDNDSAQEAVAFYLPSGEAQTVHMLIMDCVDGEWVTIGNYTSKSSTVDRLVFCDLDGDSKQEIVVGWSTYNSLINDLSVYLVEDGKSQEIVSESKYSDFLFGEFTNSSKDELLLLSLYTADKPAGAALVALNDTKNSLYTVSESPIDADVTSFAKLQTGDIFYGQFGAVLDGVTSAGSYNTQLLYYSEYYASLQRVFFTEDSPTNQATRPYAVLSEDIDNDGIIEIPNTFKMNIDDSQTDVIPAALIHWCEYSALDTLEVNMLQAASIVYGCRFTIPEKWDDNYTAYVNYSTNEITFFEWSDRSGPGEPLLVIKMFTDAAWNDGTSASNYTELGRNDSYVYGFITLETNSTLQLTNEEITEAFSITKQ